MNYRDKIIDAKNRLILMEQNLDKLAYNLTGHYPKYTSTVSFTDNINFDQKISPPETKYIHQTSNKPVCLNKIPNRNGEMKIYEKPCTVKTTYNKYSLNKINKNSKTQQIHRKKESTSDKYNVKDETPEISISSLSRLSAIECEIDAQPIQSKNSVYDNSYFDKEYETKENKVIHKIDFIEQEQEEHSDLDISKLRAKVAERKRRRSSTMCISNSPIKRTIEAIPREGSVYIHNNGERPSSLKLPSSPIKLNHLEPEQFQVL